MKVINCKVQSIEPLTEFVYQVRLVPNEAVDFLPGQYLKFIMSDDDKRPFSIASAPGEDFIELQIGAFGEDSYAMQVVERIKNSETVQVEMSSGEAYLREDTDRPILLVAGGTGFSYVKSIFEHLAKQKSQRKVLLYWGLRHKSASFNLDGTQATIDQLANGEFYPVIENVDENWQGKTGLVHKNVMQDVPNLCDYDIYLAGRFDMIGSVRDDFLEQGASLSHMYGDAFAFI